MKIKLLYTYKSRGPGVVVDNLISGLQNLGHEVVDKSKSSDLCVCLQDPYDFKEYWHDIIAIGPNFFVDFYVSTQFDNFLVPSKWVKNFYNQYDYMKQKKINVWPIGIDDKKWNPYNFKNNKKSTDTLIYFKNGDDNHINEAISLCDSHNMNYEVIKYGNYQEQELLEACARSKFAILITKTESQGIAYMQILSMGLPCFVFEKEIWDDMPQYQPCPASSVPYFNDECGVKISRNANLLEKNEKFKFFLSNLENFNARNFILSNHTLDISANNFLTLTKV
jgi:hypothetical protein